MKNNSHFIPCQYSSEKLKYIKLKYWPVQRINWFIKSLISKSEHLMWFVIIYIELSQLTGVSILWELNIFKLFSQFFCLQFKKKKEIVNLPTVGKNPHKLYRQLQDILIWTQAKCSLKVSGKAVIHLSFLVCPEEQYVQSVLHLHEFDIVIMQEPWWNLK